MPRLSPLRTIQLLAFAWPALVITLLYLFPGADTQAELELRLRGPLGSLEEAPFPREPARQKPGRDSGIRMFWEETGKGEFHGEIYIPPEALQPPAADAAGQLPGQSGEADGTQTGEAERTQDSADAAAVSRSKSPQSKAPRSRTVGR